MTKYAKKIGQVTAGGGGDGGSGDFASLTGSPYDNTNLGNALDAKQDRINGVISGLVLTTGSFGGTADFDVKVTEGTWYINPTQYNNIGDGDTLFLDQTYCSAGLLKYIDIVADTSSNLTIQVSAESLTPTRYTPSITEVIVGTLLVSDSLIEDNTPIVTGLTKKLESLGAVSGTVVLDCETTDFPQFYIEVGGSGATLDITNIYNVSEGTVFLRVTSTGTITFPFVSYYRGQALTTKTFDAGYYSLNFKVITGNHYFDFNQNFTTADVADSTDKRYVTDAQLVVIGNTSGTNSGDNATNTTSNSYADAKVTDAIVDGVTTVAPSQNAVFDALGLKQDTLTETNFGNFINARTEKNTLVDADEVLSDDSVDSNKAKKTTWLNVWTNYIKPKIDALYVQLTDSRLTDARNAIGLVDNTAYTLTTTGSLRALRTLGVIKGADITGDYFIFVSAAVSFAVGGSTASLYYVVSTTPYTAGDLIVFGANVKQLAIWSTSGTQNYIPMSRGFFANSAKTTIIGPNNGASSQSGDTISAATTTTFDTNRDYYITIGCNLTGSTITINSTRRQILI